MKRSIILLAAAVLLLSACTHRRGSGNIIKQEKSVSSFSVVEASGPIEVLLRQGNTHNVVIEADDNLMKYVQAGVSGNELRVRLQKGINVSNASITVTVTAPNYREVNASAAVTAETDGLVKSDGEISFKSSSAAKIVAEVDAPSVELDASSGSNIEIKGRTRNVDVQASSGAHVEADNLRAEEATAQSSSGASVDVFASIAVNASASSGGHVDYTGGASRVVKNESSGGGISAR